MTPLLVLQIADSAFPTGGFAHAGGLEAAVQLGEVDGPESLARFALEAVHSSAAFALPYLSAAHIAPGRLAEVDLRLDAYMPSHVANRSSRAQGEALLRAAGATFGGAVAALAEQARREKLPCHLATCFGAVLSLLRVPVADARRVFAFVQLRGITSAAVRLGILGPLEAQALLSRLSGTAQLAADETAAASLEDAAQTSPLLDLIQGHQDRLYSRLFRS